MPSRHSASSHSSRSRSSGSSFRSSSSRSSPSSRSSGSRSAWGGGPSGHSATSHSGSPVSGGSAGRRQANPQPAPRPRVNQPVGFLITQTLRPKYYYGRRHDYVYYPEAWTDKESGTFYEKGYYDENGRHYDSVAFQTGGRYQNVSCHCPYCDGSTVLDLNNSPGTTQKLECPNCGAPMEIQSELDEIAWQPNENTHVYNAEESLNNAFGQPKKGSRALPIVVFLIAATICSRAVKNGFQAGQQPTVQNVPVQQLSVVEQNSDPVPGDALYLEKQADGSYHRVTDVLRADRVLYYDTDADSFYDESADCWVWYNTDVSPAVWQYWVEGISSDFGDFGWMEHDAEGWWIEASAGNWIKLPPGYRTDGLWYIA